MSDHTNLSAKYRPQTVKEIRGQPDVVSALAGFVSNPVSTAFLFHGPTGVGKTSAAWALGFDLGCDVEDPFMGGVSEIPSGMQDGASVDTLLRGLRLCPMLGSGWKLAIVNEADQMTKQAEAIWLDGLEHLPPKTVIIFTTNDVTTMGSRFVSRCESLEFSGEPARIQAAVASLVREVWRKETGKSLKAVPEDVGLFDIAGGSLSFRLALQQIAPYIRSGKALPPRFQAPIVRDSDSVRNNVFKLAGRKAADTRRRNLGKAVG